ncbi:unnamed protein product, partial [Meganyctiphanes norvegica]
GDIKCHVSREENTRKFMATTESIIENSGPVRNISSSYDHAQLSTSRHFNSPSEERENKTSKDSHGVHNISSVTVSANTGKNITHASYIDSSTNKRPLDLCSYCACSEGNKMIYCEHKHISQ